MVAVSGTMAADVVHIVLGVPYLTSTIFFSIVLIVIFALWYAVEKTLSIHSIYTLRRELFYWATVITTFALGTAAGDLTAITLHFGYLSSGFLFAALIALITLTHYAVKGVLVEEHRHQSRNAVLAFWLAYILTRPLGASIGDYLSQSKDDGGLGVGTVVTSAIFIGAILVTIIYLTLTKKDQTPKEVIVEEIQADRIA